MDQKYLSSFCTTFYASHYIPIFHLSDQNEILFKSTGPLDILPCHHVLKELDNPSNPTLCSSSDTGMWGRVILEGNTDRIVFGPVYSEDITDEMLRGFMKWHGIPSDRKEEIFVILNDIPKYTYYHFLNMLSFLHFTLNGESMDLLDQYDSQRTVYDRKISATQAEDSVAAKEENRQHGTYGLEQQIADLVRDGDVNRLRSFLSEMITTTTLHEGKLAESPLRQAKNIFIGAVSIFSRNGAIAGGLDVEETYRLVDAYIQECERLTTMEEITTLQFNMLIDFTSRVGRNKIPEGISEDIYRCIQFINNHTNESIGIDEVAAHIGRSRSYLTEKFRKETGKTVTGYILDAKLSEAQSLLKHTDKSLSEIAYYLSFSSQAYFQTAFKKKYGETPGAFRKQHKT